MSNPYITLYKSKQKFSAEKILKTPLSTKHKVSVIPHSSSRLEMVIDTFPFK